MRYLAAVLSLVLLAVSFGVAQGYEVVDVKAGGTLKGIVTFKGSVPKDEAVVIDKDVDYCGKEQKLGKYAISDSRVKNVVVWIDGIKKGKAIPQKAIEVTFKNCKAEPLVSVGFVGGKYLFRNEDAIMHTLQLKLGLEYQKKISGRPLKDGATIYNLAFPRKGMQIERPIKGYHRYSEDTGFIQIKSNIHSWIRGYIFIFDHPYASITDEKGSFVMNNLPPGEYVLNVWHEGFGMQERKIKVTPGEITDVEIEFGK